MDSFAEKMLDDFDLIYSYYTHRPGARIESIIKLHPSALSINEPQLLQGTVFSLSTAESNHSFVQGHLVQR